MARTERLTPMEEAAIVSPSMATSGNDLDAMLRSHGWTIVQRPRVGPDIWERRGQLATVSEAFDVCLRETGD